VSTGERGDRILLDDPHNVIKAESDAEREKTVRFVRESMSNRLNDERSAIAVIQWRPGEVRPAGPLVFSPRQIVSKWHRSRSRPPRPSSSSPIRAAWKLTRDASVEPPPPPT
jgi:hypothetical protein